MAGFREFLGQRYGKTENSSAGDILFAFTSRNGVVFPPGEDVYLPEDLSLEQGTAAIVDYFCRCGGEVRGAHPDAPWRGLTPGIIVAKIGDKFFTGYFTPSPFGTEFSIRSATERDWERSPKV